MKYTHEDFARFLTEVEEQGGTHLDETCASDEIVYEYPDGVRVIEHTTGCEDELLFEIVFDPSETVTIEVPMLEPDPNRPNTWIDHRGDERQTTNSAKDKHGRVQTELVEFEGEDNDGYEGSVVVCARDDNVGMWPRFRHVIQDSRSR